MKLLFLKLGLFSVICLSIVTFILMNYGGNIDYFYEKFTSPKAKSMIIGDSRAFQGIQPRVLNSYFADKGYDIPFLNYSFTIAQAMMGPLYNESILKKLDTSSKNGVFIISITPEMLSSNKKYEVEKGNFKEEGQPPHNMNFVTMNPNYEYLFKNLSFFHFKAIFRKNSTLHKDGWLEETNLPTEESQMNMWRKKQIDLFLEDAEGAWLSDIRIQSLIQLIETLNQYGSVYVVRMPISNEFLNYEKKYFPDFENVMDAIVTTKQITYFDFNTYDKKYKTYDGHHIDKFSGKEFTKTLCDSIYNKLTNNAE